MARLLLTLFICVFLSCDNPVSPKKVGDSKKNGRLSAISNIRVTELPEELAEISGISFINDSVLLAIQDEDGILYFYNVRSKQIVRRHQFGGEGDYEDVVVVGSDAYVITSEGTIIQIKDFRSPVPAVRSFDTPFEEDNDIEGLGYDSLTHRLLITPKEYGLPKDQTSKQIYGFDLNDMKLMPAPLYEIKLADIEAEFRGNTLEESSKKFLKVLGNENMNKVFRSSAVTVHPRSGEIYVLSSINGLILTLSREGVLTRLIQFNNPEFKQPEGIAFSPSGKLYISNEGADSGIGNIIEVVNEN